MKNVLEDVGGWLLTTSNHFEQKYCEKVRSENNVFGITNYF